MTIRLSHLVASDVPLPPGAEAVPVAGLTADSRAVRPGFVFAALPGTHVDGAKFIPQAIAAGAIAVLAGEDARAAGVPLITAANPRQLFARMAARFYGRQPDTIVAVTGTSGKTSVATFVREIWTSMGFPAASLGTVGVVSPAGTIELEHTTPDAMRLQEIAGMLAEEKVEHLAIEASSHGLDQYRLDGLRIAAAGFTNLSHDHLDYHPTVEDYFNAKMRLFEELVAPGVWCGAKATKKPGRGVEDDGMRDTPPHGPERQGLCRQIIQTIQPESCAMCALDPHAHRMQLVNSRCAFCKTHGELLVWWGGGEVFGAEAVDDDKTPAWGEEFGRFRHEVVHVLDAACDVDRFDCEYDVEGG